MESAKQLKLKQQALKIVEHTIHDEHILAGEFERHRVKLAADVLLPAKIVERISR